MTDDFAVFILTNGRPDNVKTYTTLRRSGYTGKIYLLVDDLDKTKDDYIKKFGNEVVVFDKKAIAEKFDTADNFDDMRAIVYARNASFEVAEHVGVKYFVEFDDDYTVFLYRYNHEFRYVPKAAKNLDAVFSAVLDFYKTSGVTSVALAQGGDFIGGPNSPFASGVKTKRKAMNSFFCSTERPFKFLGRVNEDVNTYTRLASTGAVFLTINQVSLEQTQTQTNAGGMTELYLDSGTYLKSFYSVMFHPSSIKIKEMGDRGNYRLHHAVSWKNTTPMILREEVKRGGR